MLELRHAELELLEAAFPDEPSVVRERRECGAGSPAETACRTRRPTQLIEERVRVVLSELSAGNEIVECVPRALT